MLQLLDLAISSPLKYIYYNLFNTETTLTDNSVINKQRILLYLVEARNVALTKQNIISG